MRAPTLRLLPPALLALCAVWPAHADGYFGYEAELRALGATDTEDFSSTELRLRGELSRGLGDHAELTVRAEARQSWGDLLQGDRDYANRSRADRPWQPAADTVAELRELYVDVTAGRAFLRLGKQQVVWGQADAIKLLDRLNPQSFREFILEDYDRSRIPLWSALAEYDLLGVNLQAVWIPDLTFHDIPQAGDWFAWTSPILAPRPPPGVPVEAVAVNRPKSGVRHAEWAVKASTFAAGWDLSLNYASLYADVPFVEGRPGTQGLIVESSYHRTRLMGGTASTAVGSVVARAEVAVRKDAPVLAWNTVGGTSSVAADTVSWLVGADYSGWRNTLLSVQVMEDRLLGHDADFVRADKEHLVTVHLEKTFGGDRWMLELEGIHSFDLNDGLVRVSLQRTFTGGWTVALGHDAFYGDPAGIFGQFAERSLLALTLAYQR